MLNEEDVNKNNKLEPITLIALTSVVSRLVRAGSSNTSSKVPIPRADKVE